MESARVNREGAGSGRPISARLERDRFTECNATRGDIPHPGSPPKEYELP